MGIAALEALVSCEAIEKVDMRCSALVNAVEVAELLAKMPRGCKVLCNHTNMAAMSPK